MPNTPFFREVLVFIFCCIGWYNLVILVTLIREIGDIKRRKVRTFDGFDTSYVVLERTGDSRDLLWDNYGEEFPAQKQAERFAKRKNKKEKTDKYYVARQQKKKRYEI